MNKKVSIIIPIYNSEETLRKCLNSIINQTYKNSEIILVNDGSTDSSEIICEEYRKNNANIIVINKKNEGPGKAREEGLKLSNGEYISFVDADDYLNLDFYATMIKKIEEEKADIVQCGYNKVNSADKILSIVSLKNEKIIGKYNNAKFYITQKNCTNYLCNKIFVKTLFTNIQFTHLFAGEDACVLTQLYSNANKSITIPNCLYYYVQTDNSLCRGKYSLKKLDSITAGEFMYNYQKKYNPNLADYYKLYICSNAGQCYCNLVISDIPEKELYMKKMIETFNKYFKITNFKIFKVSLKRRIFIFIFRISPKLCVQYYRRRKK